MTIHEDKDTKKNAMFKMKDCFYFRCRVEKPVGAMQSLVRRAWGQGRSASGIGEKDTIMSL